MRTYIHPLSEERVPINKALIATIIEFLEVDKYDQEKKGIVYALEDILEQDEVIDDEYIKDEFARLELDEL